MSKKIVLITGGTGLVGSAIKLETESGNYPDTYIFVGKKDADLTNYNEAKQLFEKYRPNYVINLAGIVEGLFKQMAGQLHSFLDNIQIAINVSKCSIEVGAEKCVNILSTCIYPDKVTLPIDETMLHQGPPSDNNYGFCYAKRFIDILNRVQNEHQKQCFFTSVMFTNVYGPYDNFSLVNGHVLPCLIHKAYLAKKSGNPLVVLGTGKANRQFIYSLDVAKLTLKALYEYNDPSPIMFTVDESDEISIRDAAEIVRKGFNIDQEIVFDAKFKDGHLKKTTSNKKLRILWPDFKFTPFQEGVNQTIKWFNENYETLRK